MDPETTPNRGESNIGWRDLIDLAREVRTIVDPPNTNPPAATQLPAAPAPTMSAWDTLKASPALLIGGAVAIVAVVFLVLRR